MSREEVQRTPDRTGAVDVALGATTLVGGVVYGAMRKGSAFLSPLRDVALHPPMVPARLHPANGLDSLATRGAAARLSAAQSLARRLDRLVPALLEELLQRAGVTELVLRYVDLDAVIAAVDLDSAAARLDVDAVVTRVDLDSAVARLDVDGVVRRVDVESVVDRVDVDSIVAKVDLDAVAGKLDLEAILDRLDMTAVVLSRVDLQALVQAVLDNMDLVALAEEVIDGVDLPEIIRESTGSMASDTVRRARMQGIAADEAIGRAVDRLLLRRGQRSAGTPPTADSAVVAAPAVSDRTERRP